MTKHSPFRYLKTSPEVIRLVVMMYVRFPLSLWNVVYLLRERGIEISHETVRFWWNRFGPLFAADLRKRRVHHHSYSNWQWHLDEVFVKINGETHYLRRAVDQEGEVLVTDRLPSYDAAMKEIGNAGRQETGRWLSNRGENSHQPFQPGVPSPQSIRSHVEPACRVGRVALTSFSIGSGDWWVANRDWFEFV